MTKFDKLDYGMHKKWARHFGGFNEKTGKPNRWGRRRLTARYTLAAGVIIMLLVVGVWSQFLYQTIFDSILSFELILDQQSVEIILSIQITAGVIMSKLNNGV